MAETLTPAEKPKKKPSRWGLFAPLLIFLVLLAGWTGYWFYVASQLENRIALTRQNLIDAGYHVGYSPLHVQGYPFRMFIALDKFEAIAPTGKGFAAPRLEAEASAFVLDKWVFVATEGLTYYRGRRETPDLGAIDLGEVRITGDALRASVSDWTKPIQTIAVEGLNPVFTVSKAEFPFLLQSAQRFEAYLRPNTAAVDNADFLWRVTGAKGHPESLIGRMGPNKTFDLHLEGTVGQAAKFKEGRLTAWRDGGGVMTGVKTSLHIGDLEIFGQSDAMRVDPNLALQGPLEVEIKGSGDPVTFLLGAGLIAPEYEPLARPFVGTTMTADKPVKLKFDFRDGGTYVGPLKVSDAPVVR